MLALPIFFDSKILYVDSIGKPINVKNSVLNFFAGGKYNFNRIFLHLQKLVLLSSLPLTLLIIMLMWEKNYRSVMLLPESKKFIIQSSYSINSHNDGDYKRPGYFSILAGYKIL
jgi:hypothetical protein